MSHPAYTEALDLLCRKLAEDEERLGVAFPYVTTPDGAWDTILASVSAGYAGANWSHGNWFCGFWVGLLFAAHLHSGDARFRALAEERLRLVAARGDDGNTLLDMAALHWDAASATRWRTLAGATLDALCRDYLARAPAHRGLLLHGCYSKPHDIGVDAAVLFGDFYFVEALCTAVMPNRFRPVPRIPMESPA